MSTVHLTFPGLLRSELQKTWSVPSIGWLLLLAGPAVALSIVAAAQFSPGVAVATGAMVGGAVLALAGGLSIAGEYATGSIRTTCTVAPQRGRVVAAKGLAVVVLGLAVGWAGALVGASVLGIVGAAAGPVLVAGPAVAATALLGLFLGFLIRRVAPTAIVTVTGLFLVSGLIGGVRVGDGYLVDWLFADNATALVAGTPDWGRALLSIVLWLVAAGVAAVVRLRRSDV